LVPLTLWVILVFDAAMRSSPILFLFHAIFFFSQPI